MRGVSVSESLQTGRCCVQILSVWPAVDFTNFCDLFAWMSEQYIVLVFANTVRVCVCIPACVPEAGLLGCLYQCWAVKLRGTTTVLHDCASFLSQPPQRAGLSGLITSPQVKRNGSCLFLWLSSPSWLRDAEDTEIHYIQPCFFWGGSRWAVCQVFWYSSLCLGHSLGKDARLFIYLFILLVNCVYTLCSVVLTPYLFFP